jgi:hypothetical protein
LLWKALESPLLPGRKTQDISPKKTSRVINIEFQSIAYATVINLIKTGGYEYFWGEIQGQMHQTGEREIGVLHNSALQ